MSNSLLIYSAIAMYVLATGLIALHLKPQDGESDSSKISIAYLIACVAAIAHILYAWNISHINQSLNFSLTSMLVVVSALLTLTFLVSWYSLLRSSAWFLPFFGAIR